MATKAYKNNKIAEIKESINNAKVAIVADYRGLSVAEITDLRRQLQKENSDFTVVKNTLTKVAIKDTPYELLAELLKGPAAIAFGFKDQVAPAKILTQFIKKAKKTEIKGAVLDGKLLSADEVKQLSELPSKEELYARILGILNGPASGIANATNSVIRSLVIAINEVKKQKEEAQG